MTAEASAPSGLVEDPTGAVAALLDRVLPGLVVVVGSLPPHARDLDLLVRPDEETAISRALRSAGFVADGERWARFADCSAVEVELLRARDLDVPATEIELLFEAAVPLPGSDRLAAPAPQHRILLGAVQLLGRSGHLAPGHRERLQRVIDEHPGAWAQAEDRAAEWRAEDRLERLGRALSGKSPAAHRRVLPLLRRVRATLRPRVIALSGIDGSGKSLQARALAETLERLGYPAAVTWAPLANEAWLDRLARPIKRVLRVVPWLRPPTGVEGPGRREAASNPGRILRQRSRGLTSAWATIVAVANGWSLGRDVLRHAWAGRVVVADRYHLDSTVRMRFLYDEHREFRLQRLIVAVLSPAPGYAFFLDVEPATSLARKDDGWSQEELAIQARVYREEHTRFDAERVDGERRSDELCSEIAERVWRGLG